jgi:ABC-type multidrug transport system fused ATPase/permease subunit
MASNQQMPREQRQQNSQGIGMQKQVVTKLLSARAMIVFLLLCVFGLVSMLTTFIVPFLRSDPSSLPTQLIQQVGIALFVTGIISLIAGRLIDNTRNQLQDQISDFLQNVVTDRLDKIQQDTADQTKHLEAEVTRKLEGMQDDFKMQTDHLRAEVTKELEDIQENIRQQTNSFVATSASLQTMGVVGMSRMYLKRDDAIEDIKQDLANLNLSRIRLIGISLNDFVRDGGIYHGIWKLISEYIRGDRVPPNADRKLAVQVLIIDPICLGAHLRSKGEHRESKAVVQSRLAKDVDFTAS